MNFAAQVSGPFELPRNSGPHLLSLSQVPSVTRTFNLQRRIDTAFVPNINITAARHWHHSSLPNRATKTNTPPALYRLLAHRCPTHRTRLQRPSSYRNEQRSQIDLATMDPKGGNFVAPGQQRYLRACMVCSIVMTQTVSLAPAEQQLSPLPGGQPMDHIG